MGSGKPDGDSSSPSDNPCISALEKGGARGEQLRVELSDGSSFFISALLAFRQSLKAGDPLSPEQVLLLQEESLRLEAEKKALGLLARAPHSVQALRRKLYQRRLPAQAVERAVDGLIAAGLLNDEDYAREWIQLRLRRHPEGKAALIAGLRQHGVDRETAERVTHELVSFPVELESARRLADKLRRRSACEAEELAERLRVRTFAPAVIAQLLEELSEL